MSNLCVCLSALPPTLLPPLTHSLSLLCLERSRQHWLEHMGNPSLLSNRTRANAAGLRGADASVSRFLSLLVRSRVLLGQKQDLKLGSELRDSVWSSAPQGIDL